MSGNRPPGGPQGGQGPDVSLENIRIEQVTSLARLAAAETTEPSFGRLFATNPAAALAAKGIVIQAAEADRIRAQIGLRGPEAAETEVSVSVKVKI